MTETGETPESKRYRKLNEIKTNPENLQVATNIEAYQEWRDPQGKTRLDHIMNHRYQLEKALGTYLPEDTFDRLCKIADSDNPNILHFEHTNNPYRQIKYDSQTGIAVVIETTNPNLKKRQADNRPPAPPNYIVTAYKMRESELLNNLNNPNNQRGLRPHQ